MDEKIIKKVNSLIKKYETNDPFEIANALNIFVVNCQLGNVSGNYKYIKRGKWIFINSFIEEEAHRKVVMAHELGHAILHPKENCCFMGHQTLLLTSKIERQANIFAAYLLISSIMLNDYTGYTKDQFCKGTGYPKELLELRLK